MTLDGARAGRIPLRAAAAYVIALVVVVIVGAIVVAALGGDVVLAFRTFFRSSLGTASGLAQTLNKICPLLLGGLAVGLTLRAGYFNIGVDGQIYAGAIAATGVALALGDVRGSMLVLVPVVLLVGAIGGGAFAAIPGVLRARFGVNEIFVTVMLNFVAAFLTEYLTTGPWNDPMAGEAITRLVPERTTIPLLSTRTGAHAGVFIALAAAALVWLLLERTTWGFEIRALGANPRAARVAGIAEGRIALLAFVLSGALAGLAGAIEVAALHHRLILGLTPGYGVAALLVAVLARGRTGGIVVAAIAMATLLVGSDSLQRSIGVPASAALVFQAVIVLCVLRVEARSPAAVSA